MNDSGIRKPHWSLSIRIMLSKTFSMTPYSPQHVPLQKQHCICIHHTLFKIFVSVFFFLQHTAAVQFCYHLPKCIFCKLLIQSVCLSCMSLPAKNMLPPPLIILLPDNHQNQLIYPINEPSLLGNIKNQRSTFIWQVSFSPYHLEDKCWEMLPRS